MIGNVTSGSTPKGLLNYCYYEKGFISLAKKEKLTKEDVRGEIFYIQNLSLKKLKDGRFDMDNLARQFKEVAAMKNKLKKYVWHQSFSFPIGETPSKEQMTEITKAFSRDFSFEENQLIAFKHNDTKHAHFHIAANRINYNGTTTAKDSKSKLRTGEFCRKIELEMGFQITPNMKALSYEKKEEESYSLGAAAEHIRLRILHYLSLAKSLEDLKEKLKKDGIKTYLGRGISFLDEKSGSKFKGSALGREFSKSRLEKSMAAQKQKTEVVNLKQDKGIKVQQRIPKPNVKTITKKRARKLGR